MKRNELFPAIRNPRSAWILFATLAIGVPSVCHSDEVITGKVYVYRPGESPRLPERGTVEINFLFKDGVTGDSIAVPDWQNGVWRGKFFLTNPNIERAPIDVEPNWTKSEGPKYLPEKGETVWIPLDREPKLTLHLFHPVRLGQRHSIKADKLVRGLKQTYLCMEESGNDRISRCWERQKSSDPELVKNARDKAARARQLYDEAHELDPRNAYIWHLANLETSLALFCEAAETLKKVDMEKSVPGQSHPTYAAVYSAEAQLSCAKGLAGQERMDQLRIGMKTNKAFLENPVLIANPTPSGRIIGAWFDMLQLTADNPKDLSQVAEIIYGDEQIKGYWENLRKIASRHFGLQFADEESSHFIIAGRLETICRRLGKNC